MIRIKTRARALGITAIDLARGELVLTAATTTKVDPQLLVNLMTQGGGGLRVSPGHKIHAPAPKDPSQLFVATRQLLVNLGAA